MRPIARDLATMFGAFVLASALAGALGAINLGTALAFGQIAFAMPRLHHAQALTIGDSAHGAALMSAIS